MWVFTSGGFVSAVEHPTDTSKVMVRARDHKSLEVMLDGIALAGSADGDAQVADYSQIITKEFSDYPWRVALDKGTFALFLQFEVLNYLNYKNYKNALTKTRGDEWHDAAMGVWTEMLAVEDVPKGPNWRFEYSKATPDGQPARRPKKNIASIRDEFYASEEDWAAGLHSFDPDTDAWPLDEVDPYTLEDELRAIDEAEAEVAEIEKPSPTYRAKGKHNTKNVK